MVISVEILIRLNLGRTLQELIAPRVVRFYDRNWEYCGTRSDFEDEISEITGIEPIYLQHRHFKDAPIAIKMSWAAKRTTTRLEDEAYCMLGLFNIFMPLIYGEGKMAFFRLQQEIVKVNPDQSIYAWGLPEDLSVSLLRKPPHCGTFQGIGWRNDFKYGELDSRLFAESARDFRHSGSLIPICHVTSDAAKTTGAQTITIELSIVAPEGENFHIGLLPFSSGAYPGHSIGMILELRNNRYCRVSWRRARNSGFTFAVPTSYVIQSHKKEITLLSQSFREPNHRETNLPQRGQNLFFMPGLQRNRASVMRPLDFRIIELSYKSSEQRKTSCFNFRSSPHHDEYAIIQLNMHESTPSFCTIAVKVTPQTLGIRQADSHDTCSSFRNKQFYDAILLTIENEKFIAKVISMSTLDTFVVQMHRIELNQDGRAASQNNSFLWYTWSIKTMVTEGRLGTRLEVNERSTELQ